MSGTDNCLKYLRWSCSELHPNHGTIITNPGIHHELLKALWPPPFLPWIICGILGSELSTESLSGDLYRYIKQVYFRA
jgi:hypothetical protein